MTRHVPRPSVFGGYQARVSEQPGRTLVLNLAGHYHSEHHRAQLLVVKSDNRATPAPQDLLQEHVNLFKSIES